MQTGDLVCLSGELGAGKTTLTVGIAQGWGAQEIVTSPTFVLVNEYTNLRGCRLYHLDAYRLKDAADAHSIALDDLLADEQAVVLIEWAERLQPALPTEGLWITLSVLAEEQRHLRLEARGARYAERLQKLSLT